jgi:urease accessory protein
LNPERVGRDGFLRLRFARSGERTILSQSRFSLPLQVLTPLALEDGSCYLMLLNPTGGVLGGDRLVTEIELEAGAHVCLGTPSATRVYRTAGAPAILETAIRLGADATLEYFPDHVIPHAGSALQQSLRMEMAPGSCAILLDSIASGRRAHGERWSFRELDSSMDVTFGDGRSAYINRTKIVPSALPPDRPGRMEGLDYVASVAVFAEGFEQWPDVAEALNSGIECIEEIRGGASLLARGGCVARVLARSAWDMTHASKVLCDSARMHLLGLPPFDHRKY